MYAIRRPALVFSVSSGDLKAEYMEAKIASPPKGGDFKQLHEKERASVFKRIWSICHSRSFDPFADAMFTIRSFIFQITNVSG